MVTPPTLRGRKAGDEFVASRSGRCQHCQRFTVRRMVRQSKSGTLYARPVCFRHSCISKEGSREH